MSPRAEGIGAVVVGSGFGARVHVPALRAAGFRVEALVGRDAARTARRAGREGVPRGLTSLEEALALPGVEAVTVATPPAAHAPCVRAAIAAGKHVLCEKPFALDATEAAAMLGAARAAGVVHRVGFEFRFAPGCALLARAIAEGRIGEARLATFVGLVPLLADPATRMPGWWWDPARGGGWLAASGSHAVDQIRATLGEIESVSATLSLPGDGKADDGFTILFRTRGGAAGVLQQSGASPGRPSSVTRIVGTTGSVWIEDDAVWLADADGTRPLENPAALALPPVPGRSEDPVHRYTHLELGPFTRLLESFRDEIVGDTPSAGAVPPPTFADGLASMDVLDAVRLSAAEGSRIGVPDRSGAGGPRPRGPRRRPP